MDSNTETDGPITLRFSQPCMGSELYPETEEDKERLRPLLDSFYPHLPPQPLRLEYWKIEGFVCGTKCSLLILPPKEEEED